MTNRKIKITGERSIKTKLHRLAYELEHDARRVLCDHPGRASLADTLQWLSSKMGDAARRLED